MSRYTRGDVVLVWYPWEEDGVIKVKKRPGVVLEECADRESLIIKCTHKNRSEKLLGIWVLADSDEGKEMGILENTFINLTEQLQLKNYEVVRIIGYCPFIDKIDEMLGR
jgi:hypothetical protein